MRVSLVIANFDTRYRIIRSLQTLTSMPRDLTSEQHMLSLTNYESSVLAATLTLLAIPLAIAGLVLAITECSG